MRHEPKRTTARENTTGYRTGNNVVRYDMVHIELVKAGNYL